MKKNLGRAAALALCFCLVLAAGCGEKPKGYALRLTVSSWSGWEEDYQPEEKLYEYELAQGESYTVVDPMMGDWSFTVKEVGEGKATIQTELELAPSGWSMSDPGEKTFTLEMGRPLDLSTLTFDGGGVYQMELVETL